MLSATDKYSICELYLGLCKLENEILKEAKTLKNDLFWSKNVMFSVLASFNISFFSLHNPTYI